VDEKERSLVFDDDEETSERERRRQHLNASEGSVEELSSRDTERSPQSQGLLKAKSQVKASESSTRSDFFTRSDDGRPVML